MIGFAAAGSLGCPGRPNDAFFPNSSTWSGDRVKRKQRGPDQPRGAAVDADLLLAEQLRQAAGEVLNRALAHNPMLLLRKRRFYRFAGFIAHSENTP